MRTVEQTRPKSVGMLMLAAALLAGCSSTVDGHPTASPGGGGPAEPSLRPPRTSTPPPPSATPTPSSPSPTRSAIPRQPSDAIPLPPDDSGYVFIETKSGRTRCQISTSQVGCEAEFTNSPLKDGQHANGVSIDPAGNVHWVLGNLGDIPVVTIDYLTYLAQGWTIKADLNGTRFTNSRTGHGMFVSIDKVDAF